MRYTVRPLSDRTWLRPPGTRAPSNSSTGVRGVVWDAREKRYQARVKSGGKTHWGGYHSTLAAAEAAVVALRCRLMTHNDADRKSQEAS